MADPLPPWSIEPYRPEVHGIGHLTVVAGVYREYGFTWDPAHPYFADLVDPSAHYGRNGGFFSVGVIDRRVVGTIGGTPEGPAWELHRLHVVASARRHGLGAALVRTFLDHARSAGASQAILWSDKLLVDAHRLYRRLGFEVIGERTCADPDQAIEWGMALDLRRS